MSLSPAAQATVDKINLLAARVAAVVQDDANHEAASAALETADMVGINNALDNLNASLPARGPGAPTLVIAPTSITLTAGEAGSIPLSISGGTPPYHVSGLPAGVTFDGSNVAGDATTEAGSGSLSVSDSSNPPVTASISVAITANPAGPVGGAGAAQDGGAAASQGTGSAATDAGAGAGESGAGAVDPGAGSSGGAGADAPVPLTVDPSTVSLVAGTADSVPLAISGGAAPYSVNGLPPGVIFDGTNLNADASTLEGSTTASVVDSDGALADLTVVVAPAAA